MLESLSSRAFRLGVVAVAATSLVAAFGGSSSAAPQKSNPASDHRVISGNYNGGKALPFSAKLSEPAGPQEGGAVVGTVRSWPALDDHNGVIYTKRFRLRGVGNKIEIWVAENLAYANPNDCRNTIDNGAPITVTDAQVTNFISEFDNNMYPLESAAFSVPPNRDGSSTSTKKLYTKYFGVPNRTYSGKGDRIVTLVDNVRDTNFYDPTDINGRTFIGGFFYSVFNEMTNRNVMTIDSFDWKHRTGDFETQTDDSTNPEYVACGQELLRPFGNKRGPDYEGTFAHEYQHLLEYYEDTNEVNWVNEGLSDWAQTLTGYVDPLVDPADPTADGHLSSFFGFQPANFGGPEQSMTRWNNQGGPETLADYGAVYSFMEYIWSHFGGDATMRLLHRENKNGLAGLQTVLDTVAGQPRALDVIHDWLASMALDAAIEDGSVPTSDAAALETASLRAKINWDTDQAYSTPGAPTNGGDFIKLGSGQVTFAGQDSYRPAPEWTQDGSRLYSGKGDDLDRGIARRVTVPSSSATVSVGLEYDTEPTWDFAFVQVYDTDTNAWVSLESPGNTTAVANPDADPKVVANLPGLTGTGGPATYNFTVPAKYTDKEVWLAVRYITDGSVQGEGVWLSSLSVGGTPVADATTLSSWISLAAANPVAVESWTVQVVGFNATQAGRAFVTLTPQANGTVTGSIDPVAALGFTPTTLGAIVTADDSTETVSDYARYELRVGGVLQPGG